MITSYTGIELIKSFEGFRNKAYLCPAGIRTIGYGHVIKKDENYEEISEQQAINILKQDILHTENIVQKMIKADMNNNQFSAIVSFIFNLGGSALQRSTLRQVINRGEHGSVGIELQKWIWANGRILRGLVWRRRCEINLYYGIF